MSKQKLHLFIVPIVLYLGSYVFFYHLGFKELHVPWDFYQLLDRQALIRQPGMSILLLHSQPPLLNSLLILLLAAARIFGSTPEMMGDILFFFLGLISIIFLYLAYWKLSSSPLISTMGILIVLLNPAFYLFGNLYFYPLLLFTFFSGLLFTITQLFYAGEIRYFVLSLLFISLINLTRSMYQMWWVLLVVGSLLLLTYLKFKKIALKQWIQVFVFLVLINIWPVKNKVLFGQYTFSTWEGWNLSSYVETDLRVQLNNYIIDGTVPDDVRWELETFLEEWDLDREKAVVLTDVEKTTGSRNWNHFIFFSYNQQLRRDALKENSTNIKKWIGTSLVNYFFWTQPSFVNNYQGRIRGSSNLIYQRYAEIIQNVFFYDFRSAINQMVPSTRNLFEWIEVPYSLFGLIIFPGIMIASIIQGISCYRKSDKNKVFVISFSIINIIWVLFIPMLSDGTEGNRMRFAILPLFLTLIVLLLTRFKKVPA